LAFAGLRSIVSEWGVALVTHKETGLLLLALAFALSGCLFDSEGGKDGGSLAIDGYVRDDIDAPIKGVTIRAYLDAMSEDGLEPSASTVTDSRGYYRIPFGASVQSLVIIPSKDLCRFTPPKISYYDPDHPIHNENFLGFCGSMHRIEGNVRTPEDEPVKGVAIMIRDDLNLWPTTVFTNQDGYYIVSGIVPGHTYTMKPAFAGYRFSPSERVYEDLAQDFTDEDFTAVPTN
jgi:hypothetical protein